MRVIAGGSDSVAHPLQPGRRALPHARHHAAAHHQRGGGVPRAGPQARRHAQLDGPAEAQRRPVVPEGLLAPALVRVREARVGTPRSGSWVAIGSGDRTPQRPSQPACSWPPRPLASAAPRPRLSCVCWSVPLTGKADGDNKVVSSVTLHRGKWFLWSEMLLKEKCAGIWEMFQASNSFLKKKQNIFY